MGVMDGENEEESGRAVSKEEKQPFVFFSHWQVVTGDKWSAEQVSANSKSRNLLLPCLCGVLWQMEA